MGRLCGKQCKSFSPVGGFGHDGARVFQDKSGNFPVQLVILGQQNVHAAQTAFRFFRGIFYRDLLGNGKGKRHINSRTNVHFAFDANRAVHTLQQRFYDGHAQPGTHADALGHGVCLHVGLEDLLQKVLLHANTGVANRDM